MRPWIEKQRNIIDFTLSSLLRRKGKNLALLASYVLVVFLLASVMFFTHALKREASLVLKEAPEIVVQSMTAGRHELISRDYIRIINSIKGVRRVQGRLWGYYYDPVVGANYTFMAPRDFPYRAGELIIGQGVSAARQAFPGDMLPFRTWQGELLPFTILKTLSRESELVSADLILVSEQDFRALFGTRKDLFTDITVSVRNPKEISTVAAKIARSFPETRVITRNEILRTYDSIFDWRSGIIVVMLSVAALAFVIFAWDKASGLSAEERKEIGILKAIGWETSDVLLMKFWEGTIISLSSFLAGLLLAYVHVFSTSVVLFAPVLKGWSVLYPEFRLVPFIDPYQVATLFFLTVVPYTVATIIPSWRAATIDPDSVMRS